MSVQIFPKGDVSAVIISDINFSAGTTSNNLSAVTFSNSNGVSFGLNGSVITASAAAGGGGITNIKVSAGTLSALRSDLTFDNSNGVSFGLATNGIITGTVATNYQSSGAYLTTAMLSNAATISNVNVSAGTTSNNLSALTFSNSNGVSFGLNGSVITGTVATNYQSAGAYLTTAALSQDSSKYAFTGFTTTTVAGAVVAGTHNTDGLKLAVPAYLTTAQSVGAYLTTAALSQDSSKYAFTGFTTTTVAGDVIAGTHNTDGLKLAVPAFLTAAAGGGITNINVSAGTTSNNLSALTFSNSNGVSFGLDASTITATVRTDYQSAGAYLTTAALSQDSSKYAGTNGAITGGSITVNTSGVSVNLPAYLTTAMLSNAATISNVNVSAGTTSNNLSAFVFSNSNGVSFGLNGSTMTGTVATNYQSQGAYLTTAALSQDSSRYALTGFTTTTVGGAVVAGTHNTDGLKLAVPGYLTTAQSPGAYLTTAALSADSSKYAFTGFTTTTIAGDVIAGTHNTDGLKLAVPAYLTAAPGAGITNINISAGTTSNDLSAFVFSNSNGVSFGLDGSTVTGSISTTMLSEFAPFIPSAQTSLGQNSLYFAPFDLPQSLSAYRLNLFHSFATTLSASNQTGTGGMTCSVALYSRGTGASTERIMSIWSGSWYMTYSNSSHTAFSITHPMGISNSTAISTSVRSAAATDITTYLANSIAGQRIIPLPMSLTLNPNRYWIAVAGSTNTVSTKYQVLASMLMVQVQSVLTAPFAPFGTSTNATNPSISAGQGTYSATSAAFPVSVALSNSDIRALSGPAVPYFGFSAYTTATNIL